MRYLLIILSLLSFSFSKKIYGCTIPDACNFNPKANVFDGSCKFLKDACHDCEGEYIGGNDCAGNCGGPLVLDKCNLCGGDDSSCIRLVLSYNHETILFNEKKISISDLEELLESNSNQFQFVQFSADANIPMSIIRDLELVLKKYKLFKVTYKIDWLDWQDQSEIHTILSGSNSLQATEHSQLYREYSSEEIVLVFISEDGSVILENTSLDFSFKFSKSEKSLIKPAIKKIINDYSSRRMIFSLSVKPKVKYLDYIETLNYINSIDDARRRLFISETPVDEKPKTYDPYNKESDIDTLDFMDTDIEGFGDWGAPPPKSNSRPKWVQYDKAPTPKKQISPKYPDVCKQAGIEGTVVISFWLDENGAVDQASIEILESVPCLDQVCIDAIKKSKWRPARQGKKKVGIPLSMPFNFTLEN